MLATGVLCRARSWAFRSEVAPLAGKRLGEIDPRLSAEARRLRGKRHVGPADQLEHGAHMGAGAGRRRRARRAVVRNAAGRALSLGRSRPELGNDATLWEHPKRKQWMGGGADLPASIPSASIRATPSASGSRSRPAASGSPRTPAQAGRSAARACGPTMSRPSSPTTPSRRTSTASCNARPRRIGCGCSTTTASSFPPTRAAPLPRSPGLTLRLSDSRSSCIRATRIPPGSCPRSRTRNASRARASSWSRAPATAARALRS